MSGKFWYVLHTKPRKEALVNNYLCAGGFETFFPVAHITPANPRAAKIRPYFPRYLFVHTDLSETGESGLQWSPGTVGLVRFGGEPAVVPDHTIYEIEQQIAEIERAGGIHLDGLKRGDKVSIAAGPFADCEAIFDLRLSDGERVQIFLYWLGRRVKVQVEASAVTKKPSPKL